MSSSRQSDVASNSNTGNFKAETATSGNILPLSQAKEFLDNNLNSHGADPVSHIRPQNVAGKRAGQQQYSEANQGNSQGENVAQAVIRLNDYIQNEQRDLEFTVTEKSGKSMVKVVSRQSGDLIRFIPVGEAIDLARKLNDQEPFRLFSAQV